QRLVTWGDAACGGVLPQDARLPAAVKSIHCTRRAFAVLLEDDSVVAWGDSRRGGDVGRADVRSGVRSVHATRGAFAGLKDDGQVVAWGDPECGGGSGVQDTKEKNGGSERTEGDLGKAESSLQGIHQLWHGSGSSFFAAKRCLRPNR
ncbi:unnamed protein product, partial [Polarella glacialis]